MNSRVLDVWLYGVKAGQLKQRDGKLIFVYDAAYLASEKPQALSVSLPLQDKSFNDKAARPFFAGLLPDETKRDQVARILGVSTRNDFALLHGIGGECAGAVSLTKAGTEPAKVPSSQDYRILSQDELIQLLDELPTRPLLAGEKGIRILLAGAQDKLPVALIDGAIALPLNGAPYTHILKPAIARIQDSVINEAFCMMLAKKADLNVASCDIRRAGPHQFLLVERYDRMEDENGNLIRLHQEDFCQALAIPPELKYQVEGGPSFKQSFDLIRQKTRPSAVSVVAYIKITIFNALIGNHDAHGKNFSLLYKDDKIQLAPFYDLLCIAAYPEMTTKMAMDIGGYSDFDEIMPHHWERLAEQIGVRSAGITVPLLLFDLLPNQSYALHQEFIQKGWVSPVLERIISVIEYRCNITRERIEKVIRVKSR
jgi:serine/threonine-protein kinase HipA